MTHRFNLKLTGAAVAFALATLAGTAQAAAPGYVSDSQNQVWTSPYGLCWKTPTGHRRRPLPRATRCASCK